MWEGSKRENLFDKGSRKQYTWHMTTTAMIIKEVESMPEEAAVEVLDFAKFLKSKQSPVQLNQKIAIKDAHGIFRDLRGIDTTIERDEDDRE